MKQMDDGSMNHFFFRRLSPSFFFLEADTPPNQPKPAPPAPHRQISLVKR